MNYERRTMTDQTRWGIDMVQQENKHRAFKEQEDIRKELSNFVFNCSVFHMHKMYEEMKRLENK